MSRENAMLETFDEITLFGKPALFTPLRIDRATVPKGLHRYEIRHDDDGQGEAVELAHGIMVNHWGTVLTRDVLLPSTQAYRLIDEEKDIAYGTGACRTVQEFMQAYPPREKEAKER